MLEITITVNHVSINLTNTSEKELNEFVDYLESYQRQTKHSLILSRLDNMLTEQIDDYERDRNYRKKNSL